MTVDDLTCLGSARKSGDKIYIGNGSANKAVISAALTSWYWTMSSTFKFKTNFVMGKDDASYGAYVEILSNSIKITNNNSVIETIPLGFTIQNDEVINLNLYFEVPDNELKSMRIEIIGQFNEYFDYTPNVTVNAYGKPFVYSNHSSDEVEVISWNMNMKNGYDVHNSSIAVFGHSYVEADTIGTERRRKSFAGLLEHAVGMGRVLNCGLGGDTCPGVLQKIPYFMKMVGNVQYALVYVGCNDSSNADTIINQLEQIVNMIKEYNVTPILCTINPV